MLGNWDGDANIHTLAAWAVAKSWEIHQSLLEPFGGECRHMAYMECLGIESIDSRHQKYSTTWEIQAKSAN